MGKDERRLSSALRQAYITDDFTVRAAAILLAVNGIDNALEYVQGVSERRQTHTTEAKQGEHNTANQR